MTYLFVHIPKTGGRNLRNIIKDNGITNVAVTNDIAGGHCRYFNKDDGYTSITLVRNPYDRLVSAYSFVYDRQKKETDIAEFRNFVKNDFKILLAEVYAQVVTFDEFTHLKLHRGHHFLPQRFFVPRGVDMLFKYETYKRSIEDILSGVGFTKPIKLKKVNASKHRHYTEYYDDEMASIVYYNYEEDFDAFGYDKNSYK